MAAGAVDPGDKGQVKGSWEIVGQCADVVVDLSAMVLARGDVPRLGMDEGAQRSCGVRLAVVELAAFDRAECGTEGVD